MITLLTLGLRNEKFHGVLRGAGFHPGLKDISELGNPDNPLIALITLITLIAMIALIALITQYIYIYIYIQLVGCISMSSVCLKNLRTDFG